MSGATEARWIFPGHGFPVLGLNRSTVMLQGVWVAGKECQPALCAFSGHLSRLLEELISFQYLSHLDSPTAKASTYQLLSCVKYRNSIL